VAKLKRRNQASFSWKDPPVYLLAASLLAVAGFTVAHFVARRRPPLA
jgi:hypothetical protein